MKEPGLPFIVRSSGPRGEERSTPLPMPDWGKWKHFRSVELWQAAALVMNIEPDFLVPDIYENRIIKIPRQTAILEFRKLFDILSNRYFDIVKKPTPYYEVQLFEIASFVKSMDGRPYELPPEFPGALEEVRQEPSLFMTSALRKLCEVAGAFHAKGGGSQKALAADLAKAHWGASPTDQQKRAMDTLAAIFRPDKKGADLV